MIFVYFVCSLVFLWIIGNLFTTILQPLFIFRPTRLSMNYPFHFSFSFQELMIETEKNAKINAILAQSKPNNNKIILYFHGNAGALDKWGHVAQNFLNHDWDCLVFDYRNYGKSSGKISEKSFFYDSVFLFDYLKNIGYQEIIIYGRSIGSGSASYLASRRQAKYLILETPFSSLKNLFFTYYPFLPKIFKFHYIFDNLSHLKSSKCPVIVFHGTNDWIVPLSCAIKIKSVLSDPNDFHIVPGANHSNISSSQIWSKVIRDKLIE